MQALAALLDDLAFAPGEAGRIARIGRYLAAVPDPDRGWGLAVLAGALELPAIGPAALRRLAEARLDPVLFALSHDFVGDLAETLALLWPDSPGAAPPPAPEAAIAALAATPRAARSDLVAAWLDGAARPARVALLKLLTGGARAAISGRLARRAFAAWSGQDPAAIDALWHGQPPPYTALFAWADGRAPRPDPTAGPLFHPLMRPDKIEDAAIGLPDPATHRAEWKWDGTRVQLVATPSGCRVFSDDADDISAPFPEIAAALDFYAVLDGELLALTEAPGPRGESLPRPAPFAVLQRRLDRRAPAAAVIRAVPVGVRLYDILFEGGEDLRPLPFDARRARLESWFARTRPAAMDLSPLLAFATPADLAALRDAGRAAGSEGLMLKRRDSPYVSGPSRGAWWHWQHEPQRIDAVLMYAEPGPGPGRGTASQVTFGVWRGETLVPVGKATIGTVSRGVTAPEGAWLERWIGAHTIARFGPVREVEKGLVLEIAFDAAAAAPRRKAGIALRSARVARLRPDKPAAEADRLDALRARLAI